MKPSSLLIAALPLAIAAPVPTAEDGSQPVPRDYATYGTYKGAGNAGAYSSYGTYAGDGKTGTYTTYGTYAGAGAGASGTAGKYSSYGTYPKPTGGYGSYGTYKRVVDWVRGLFGAGEKKE